MKKSYFIAAFSLLTLSLSGQKIILKPGDNTKPPIIKMNIKPTFDFKSALEHLKPGYIKTKWIPLSGGVKPMETKVTESQAKSVPSDGPGMVCNSIKKKLDVTSGTFMNSNAELNNAAFYPGAIYPADDFLKGNYSREVKQNRTPIVIRSADPRFGEPKPIQQPDGNSITSAIRNFRNSVKEQGNTKNLETKFRMFYSSNESLTEFILSGGGSGYGVKIDASLSKKQASSKVILTVDATKSIFTIDAASQGNNTYFSELPAGIKANNLVIINSVSYGSRILANLTIDCNSSEDAAALASSYSGYGFSANLNIDLIKKHSNKSVTLNYKQVGGGSANNELTMDVDQLVNNINNVLNTTNYDNAVPISYSIRDLAGNNMGIASTVDDYYETICYTNAKLDKVFFKIGSGKDGKNKDTYLTVELRDGNNNLVAQYKQNGNMEFNKSSWSQLLPMTIMNGNSKQSDFKKGGKLIIRTDHRNGKDDWYIDDINVKMEYEDLTTKNIDWNMRRGANQKSIKMITKDDPSAELYIDLNMKGVCSNCE